MKEKSESGGGYVRADQIDLKSLDEQLQRHLSKAWTMEKNKRREDEEGVGIGGGSGGGGGGGVGGGRPAITRQEWEIDPSKLIIKAVIARGTFGTVHRGVYDGQDVAVYRSNNRLLRSTHTNRKWPNWHAQQYLLCRCRILSWRCSEILPHKEQKEKAGFQSSRPASIRPCKRVNSNTESLVFFFPFPHKILNSSTSWKFAFFLYIRIVLLNSRGATICRLSYLHSQKIVHRDVKTENMLLDKTRTVKIADFGVARVEASNPNDMTGETGTLGYMAPEVLNGNPYNRKCDVYSFGICLWEIYCCDMPYPDLSFSEVTSAVVRQNLRPEIPRCCPSSLANVMKRCWDANPDKRPEMDEVVTMLEAIDTSKGGGMIPLDQSQGCFCFRRYRGP